MAKKHIMDKWKDNLVRSTDAIKEGVMNTDKSQTANAIAAKEKYVNGLIKSFEDGSWENGLKNAGDSAWEEGMLKKGVNAIAPGIEAKKDKIRVKMEKVEAVGNKIRSETKDMPNNNIEDALAKLRKTMEIAKREWGKT